MAWFAAGQLEPARKDYQELLGTDDYSQNARFGLEAIARRKQGTNAAMESHP